GYGLPAAVGAQIAHPDDLVIDIAGEASILMNIQEMSTAVQYRLPVKVFILNNKYMGMVRQWQELLHGGRYSESYSEALPDFVKLAEAYGGKGLRATKPSELDATIEEMIATPKPVIFDCRVASLANCFLMIPSGKAHNESASARRGQRRSGGLGHFSEGKALCELCLTMTALPYSGLILAYPSSAPGYTGTYPGANGPFDRRDSGGVPLVLSLIGEYRSSL
ncbi:MAG: hypothetical protein HPM95_09660, partial [Alphaproteobacteria bacterium]|nr:hypothetical protein [Alphaproteobacteria bacterium]